MADYFCDITIVNRTNHALHLQGNPAKKHGKGTC